MVISEALRIASINHVMDHALQCQVAGSEEGGSALSAVKINYAGSVHLASSKTHGEVARVQPLCLFCSLTTWLTDFKSLNTKTVFCRFH